MSSRPTFEVLDVTDRSSFDLLPACADPGFDHRSCDYWEEEVRGSKAARAAWWEAPKAPRTPGPRPRSDNPFAPEPKPADGFNPFASGLDEAGSPEGDLAVSPSYNPFAPSSDDDAGALGMEDPRKLRLLSRGRAVFGSYAKVLLRDGDPAVYAQFGPLSAYPRAQHIRELYPRLPQSPLPAVITCVATAAWARGDGLARRLVDAVVTDLAQRGFSAVEAYPDLTLAPDATSSASPRFWEGCGFELAAEDDRYPVMRRRLG